MCQKVDKLLIITSIIAVAIGIVTILIARTNVEINIKKSEKMNLNYSTTESNSWDVSKAGDGSITAILSEDGTLTISGIGEMKDWRSSDTTEWHGIKDTVKSVIIEEGVTSIGDYAFYNCTSLTNINIPDSITSIGDYAFYSCETLTNIKIPDSVTSIGTDIFKYCNSLVNIEVTENNTKYKDNEGVLYTKDGTKIIKYPKGRKDTSYAIPNTVTIIGSYAFSNCENLTNIIIPNTVTKIGNLAFENCRSLTNINIPNGVTSIEFGAFSWCESLTNIEIADSVTNIGESCFWKSKITQIIDNQNIEIPGILKRTQDENDILYSGSGIELSNCTIEDDIIKITDIDSDAQISVLDGPLKGLTYVISYNYWDVSKTGDGSIIATLSEDGTLTISGTGEMKDWTSSDAKDWHGIKNNVKSVIIEQGVTNIGNDAFYSCKMLTNIQIPDSVTSIGRYALSYCESLTNMQIPDSVTSIDQYALSYCESLTNIIIPDSVISIGDYAFYWCKNLVNIKISDSITSIGSWAFDYCDSLVNIEVTENNTKYKDNEGVLYTKDGTKIIKYPEGRKDTSYAIPNTVTIIGSYAFSYCKSLTKIIIPDTVTIIGRDAFRLCENLTNIIIPNSVTSIGWEAFYGCENLTNITIPNSVTSIGEMAFIWCDSLTKIIIPDSVTNIGSGAFKNIINLTIYCRSNSTAETYAISNAISYIIDDEAPTITSVEGNATNWTKDNVTLTINGAQDSLSGLAEKPYSFDGGETWQQSNSKTYEENTKGIVIQVRDKLGNTYTHETIEITKIDKQAPTITSVEGNATEWTKDDVTLTINAEDSLSGLAEKPYSFDGGETWQESNSKTYKENAIGIVVKVKDQAGNETTYDDTIEITQIDKQAPTITSVEGNPIEWTKDNVTLIINAQDSLSGLAENPYSFDGGETWQVENTKTYTENTVGIIIKVKDKLDNIATYDEIEIDKIRKLEIDLNSYKEKQEGNNTYITNIAPETTIGKFMENIDTNGTIEVYKGIDKITNIGTNLGTGMTIKITLNKEQKVFTIVIKGDINGDGKVKLSDLSKLKLSMIGTTKLEGAYKEAADLNGDGNVKLSDLSKMKLYLVGKSSL